MGRIKTALAEYNDPKYFSWSPDKIDLIGKYGLEDIVHLNGENYFIFEKKAGIKWHYTFGKKCTKCGARCSISPAPRYCECGNDWSTEWKKEQLYELDDGPLGLMMVFNYLYDNGGVLGGLKS